MKVINKTLSKKNQTELLKNKNFKNDQNYVLSKNEKINLFYFMYGVKYENGLSSFMIFLFITLLLILNGIGSYRLTGVFISDVFYIGLFVILIFLILLFIGFKRSLYNILSKKVILYKNTGDSYDEIYSKYAKFLYNSKKKGRDFYSISALEQIKDFDSYIKDKIIIFKK